MFRAKLFGAPRLEWDDLPIPPVSGVRARCVLYRLLFSFNQEVQRSLLSGMLWPESSDQQARTNLRREVHLLRRHHPVFDKCIESTRSTLRWVMPEKYELDVEQFRVSKREFDSGESVDERQTAGMHAINFYKGDLLRGYEDSWIAEKRRQLEIEWMSLAEELLELLNGLNCFESAISVARHILARDPLHESVYVELLFAYKKSGNVALAMHTYHQCASLLRTELGIAPNPALVNMYRSLTEHESERPTVDMELNQPMDRGDSRFVGRLSDLVIIERAILASGTRSRLIAVCGETGIGKTRLTEEALRLAVSRRLPVARAYCHANTSDLAFWPIKQWLKTAWVCERLAVIDEVWREEIVYLFPELGAKRINIQRDSKSTRGKSRGKIFEAFAHLMTVTSNLEQYESEPAIFFIDDLQWCDQDSLEFLQFLFNFDYGRSVKVLTTVRDTSCAPDHALPSLQRQLEMNDQLTEVALSALGSGEALSLAMNLAEQLPNPKRRPLDLEKISRWSGGNPFYLVESVRHIATMQEELSRDTTLNFPVAPKITAIVLERLYRLQPSTQKLVCHAAVIGRSFSVALLGKLFSGSDESLVEQLDLIWRERIISDVSYGEYDFSHACIREACYESLAAPTLSSMHADVAKALESLHVSNPDSVASQIAMHWEMAGNLEMAYSWYFRALHTARRNLICRDALQYVNSCLRIIDSDSPLEKNLSERMELLLYKSHMLSLIEGFGRPSERLVCDEIQKILPDIADQHQIFRALAQLRVHATFSGEMQDALNYCHREMLIARKSEDPELIVESYRSLTFVHFASGNYGDMIDTAYKGVEIVHKAECTGRMDPLFPDWSVSMLRAMYAYALYLGGETNKAQKAFRDCSNYENSQGDTHVVALVHMWIASLHKLRHDVDATNRIGLSLVSFGEKCGLLKIRGMGMYFCSWAEIQNGHTESGICKMRQAIELIETTEEYAAVIEWYYELAQICIDHGETKEATKLLEKARRIVKTRSLKLFEFTRHRLKAELLASTGGKPAIILKSFERARLVAVSQSAVLPLFHCMTSEYRYRESVQLATRELHGALAQLVEKYKPSGHSHELREAESLVTAHVSAMFLSG